MIAWLDAVGDGLFVLYILVVGLPASSQYGSYGGGATFGVALIEALAVVAGFIFTMAAAELIMLFVSLEEQSSVRVSTLKDIATMIRAASLAARPAGSTTMPPTYP